MSDEYKKMLERFEQICQNVKKELCAKKEKEQEKRFIEKIDKGLTISEYDEIEYWLANVEVLDNMDYILNNRKAKILVRYLKEKRKEIERLNQYIDFYKDLIEKQNKSLERLNNIIKEVREYITKQVHRNQQFYEIDIENILEILDKEVN